MKLIRLILFALVFSSSFLFSNNLKIKFAAEGGLHRYEEETNDPIFRLNANVSYKNQFEKQYLHLNARLTPEMLGSFEDALAVKFSTHTETGRSFQKGSWNALLRSKNYFYQINQNETVYFTIADFGVSGYYLMQKDIYYYAQFNYLYRDVDTQPANQLDALHSAGGIFYNGIERTRIQFLMELENFKIKSRNQEMLNRGWRIGPQLEYKYQSRILFRTTLHYLFHFSDLSPNKQQEFRVQIVVGKFLSKKLSLFAYIDYRNLIDKQLDIPLELRYTAIQNENWYYLKLEYEPVKKLGIYLKAGYFRDLLPEDQGTFSGMQTLIGISWKTP